VFIFMFFTLTIGQLYFEYKLAHALHLEELSRRFILLNLGMSICLSLLFGFLFPAAGMVVAAAGLISTIISQPMYDVVNATRRVKTQWDDAAGFFAPRKDKLVQAGRDTWTIIHTIGKIILLPFKLLGAIARFFNKIGRTIERIPAP